MFPLKITEEAQDKTGKARGLSGLIRFAVKQSLRFRGEVVFAYAAERADPVFGKSFERSAGLDAVIGIADFGIVDVTTNIAYVLHDKIPFLKIQIFGNAMPYAGHGGLPVKMERLIAHRLRGGAPAL